MTEIHPIIQTALLVALPSGAAWYGVKFALNGTREHINRVERRVEEVDNHVRNLSTSVARLESRLFPGAKGDAP